MSQASSNSNSNAEYGPIQLSLFVGGLDSSGDDWCCHADSANPSAENSNSSSPVSEFASPLGNDLHLLGATSNTTSSVDSLCPLATEFMEVFEAVSGWEVRFQESTTSKNRRALQNSGSDSVLSTGNQARQGKFEIIDMSSDWPANTPTMHRGKCDQLIGLFSDLYGQSSVNQENFDRVQSLFTALTSPTEDDNHLVDSFAPSPTNVSADEDTDFALHQDNRDDEFDSAFVVKQEFDSNWLPEKSVWSDWSIAGASGIVGESYLDWSQQGDELTVYVGQIESNLGVGDTESSLEVNAVSRQFRVCEENTLAAFFFWDRRGGQLRSVEPGCWHTLYSHGAIVVSTDPDIQMPDSIINAQLGTTPFTAEQLAAAIKAEIGADHRVVVIKCD